MALSRAHTSVTAADVAQLFTVKQTPGKRYPAMRSMAVLPPPIPSRNSNPT